MQGRGAAIGTVCAEMAVCFIQFFGIIRKINWKSYLKYVFAFLFIGIVMQYFTSYIINLFTSTVLALAISIFAGGVLYLGGVAIFLIVTKDKLLKRIYGNKLK
jgi:predicted membrane channel-forming protein YqfA (hemolysin III family)